MPEKELRKTTQSFQFHFVSFRLHLPNSFSLLRISQPLGLLTPFFPLLSPALPVLVAAVTQPHLPYWPSLLKLHASFSILQHCRNKLQHIINNIICWVKKLILKSLKPQLSSFMLGIFEQGREDKGTCFVNFVAGFFLPVLCFRQIIFHRQKKPQKTT